MSTKKPGNYHAWLLRLWRNDERSPWRVRLENPYTGQTRSFSSLAKLYEFLDRKTGPNPDGETE